jgi:hypothetical protein
MIRKYLGLVVSLVPLLSANATERRVYPGVILSNRSTPTNERSLEEAAKSNRFVFISAERLASGSIYLSDKRVGSSPFIASKRAILCKTAKIRRIIKSARGHITCSPNDELAATIDPDDTLYSLQYAHTAMNTRAAWDVTSGSDSLIAVVIDTGVDYNHNDLRANMWQNPYEIPDNGKDDDQNGYIDDVHGINAIKNTGNPLDDNGHGTHVAGIIGAVGNNSRGIVGVNWTVKLAAAKFLSAQGSGSSANAIKAITYATELKKAGHKVIATNNSWGGTISSKPVSDAIIAASKEGVLFIAAAGNSASNNDYKPFYPASYQIPNVISVASTTSSGMISSFSNFGANSVHIAAPGSSIYSTVPGHAYAYKSGTSMASPQITGLALLTSSACEKLSMTALRNTILSTATRSTYLSKIISNGAAANSLAAVSSAQAVCQALSGPPTPVPPDVTPPPTPTQTPTPTLTPTPTATPIPPLTHSIVSTPSRAVAGESVTFQASTGVEYVNYGSIDVTMYGLEGTAYECDYRGYLLLEKGKKTLTIRIPNKAKHFGSFEVTFKSSRGVSKTVVQMLKTEPTWVPYSNAALACKDLAGQFR